MHASKQCTLETESDEDVDELDMENDSENLRVLTATDSLLSRVH